MVHKPGGDCYCCVGVVPTCKLFLPSEGWKIGASTPKKNANVAGIFVKGASKGASWGCLRNFVAWLGSPPDLPLIKNLKINPLFKKNRWNHLVSDHSCRFLANVDDSFHLMESYLPLMLTFWNIVRSVGRHHPMFFKRSDIWGLWNGWLPLVIILLVGCRGPISPHV